MGQMVFLLIRWFWLGPLKMTRPRSPSSFILSQLVHPAVLSRALLPPETRSLHLFSCCFSLLSPSLHISLSHLMIISQFQQISYRYGKVKDTVHQHWLVSQWKKISKIKIIQNSVETLPNRLLALPVCSGLMTLMDSCTENCHWVTATLKNP